MMSMKLTERSKKYGYEVWESDEYKLFKSKGANYVFNKKTGVMSSWGTELKDDPEYFPAPTILDIEVSTICSKGCKFCYKSNLPTGHNMSLEEFKHTVDILPKSVTQIAFGSGYYGTENPEIYNMMDYARSKGIIPNITVGCLTGESADEFAKRVGAIAISVYDKDVAYNSVKMMSDRGISQTNIHFMIADETYEKALSVIEDASRDPRLAKLNAIVFLSLKTKGRAVEGGFHQLSQEKFDNLVAKAREFNVGIGFDSCSSLKAFEAFKGDKKIAQMIEPCESGILSFYISSYGKGYSCSFTEGYQHGKFDWREGIDVLECKDSEDFLDKVWHHKKVEEFRNALLKSRKCNQYDCRTCPLYKI